MIQPKKQELDDALDSVIGKIDAGLVTCEDFNRLITKTIIGESTPESVRDRVRRRTIANPTDSHIDNETGHQALTAPKLAARVQPKRQPANQQNHGRARIAHNHSAKTQQKTMAASLREAQVPLVFQPALDFIIEHLDTPITQETLAAIPNRSHVKSLVGKLLSHPNMDRDWLYSLMLKLS